MILENNLAPIILFVYNRPSLTSLTLKALEKNKLASLSTLYIFSDGPKHRRDIELVNKVRTIVRNKYKFKEIIIIESNENKGLGSSVINGVTKVLKKHNKAIVLEDDLITNETFLLYMNEGLNYYEKISDIWSISGYSPPINIPTSYNKDFYITGRSCSWGWGTWNDRWKKIDWEVTHYPNLTRQQIKRFNEYGNDLSLMLKRQIEGKIDSWAIRWCYNQFQTQTYTVYPVKSFIENKGFGLDATHGAITSEKYKNQINKKSEWIFSELTRDEEIIRDFSKFYNLKPYNYMAVILEKVKLLSLARKIIKYKKKLFK